uniref:Uncharacterized protein n=1 Tax=Micrurus carvalhoi TaxID=3147026 RepID=A0A2H6ND65_9SAUR
MGQRHYTFWPKVRVVLHSPEFFQDLSQVQRPSKERPDGISNQSPFRHKGYSASSTKSERTGILLPFLRGSEEFGGMEGNTRSKKIKSSYNPKKVQDAHLAINHQQH